MPEAIVDARPLALLIPGLDGTGLLFSRQLAALERKYRVLPWSYGPGDDSGLNDLIRDLGRETMTEESASILVVGESFGGLVAIGYVLQYPERVGRSGSDQYFPFLSPPIPDSIGARIDAAIAIQGRPSDQRVNY